MTSEWPGRPESGEMVTTPLPDEQAVRSQLRDRVRCA